MNGENYGVHPKSIAAGKDCEKTNLLLQGVYKAATSDVDTTPFIEKILGGGKEKSKSPEKK